MLGTPLSNVKTDRKRSTRGGVAFAQARQAARGNVAYGRKVDHLGPVQHEVAYADRNVAVQGLLERVGRFEWGATQADRPANQCRITAGSQRRPGDQCPGPCEVR